MLRQLAGRVTAGNAVQRIPTTHPAKTAPRQARLSPHAPATPHGLMIVG